MGQTTEKHPCGLNRSASEFAARVIRAFLECDDEVRNIVLEMLDIMTSDDADDDEREAAALTFQEALFPEGDFGDPGIDLTETATRHEHVAVLKQMQEQEATFSVRLAKLMESKRIDQTELAKRTGVGQSAISMMLSRTCRPQRRTVVKLAEALGVSPDELWPAN